MTIKTNYDFNGIEIPNAIIRIDRLWGSSREGWTALIGVYIEKEAPAVAEVTEEQIVTDEEGVETTSTVIVAEGRDAYTELIQITDFNRSCQYKENERGYVSMYQALTDEFGGVEI